MRKIFTLMFIIFSIGVPALAKTYKTTYPNTCSEVWAAVKLTLADTENYNVESSDDSAMTATYQPKHKVHVTITETVLQRKNHVKLVPKADACEMQVVSNYSGVEHNDRDDFKKRVDEALAKPKVGMLAPPAKMPEIMR